MNPVSTTPATHQSRLTARIALAATAIIAAIAHTSAWAAGPANIPTYDVYVVDGHATGEIRNQNGEPLANAVIRVSDQIGNHVVTRSNSTGQFTFTTKPGRTTYVQTGTVICAVRPWETSGPTRTTDRLRLVVPQDIVRGQDTLFGADPKTATTIAVIGGIAVITAVALSEDDVASP